MKLSLLFRLACLLIGLELILSSPCVADSARPNVLMIGVDTLRADHLGCYGYKKNTSPAIDGLAKESIVMEQAMTQAGVTLPSLTSIMTSLYPVKHGVRGNLHVALPDSPQLAEQFKQRNYRCEAFLGNAVTWEMDWKGFDSICRGTDPNMVEQVKKKLKEDGGKPFFFWLFLYGPHRPYLPPAEYALRAGEANLDLLKDGNKQTWELQNITLEHRRLSEPELGRILALYDGAIAYTDDLIRQVLDTLRATGLMENTLVVFFADHGEELYDHNEYFYHVGSPYDSVLHIPFIFHMPGMKPARPRRSDVVQEIDIAPTLLDMLGYPIPVSFQGRSLKPLLLDGSIAECPAISEIQGQLLSLRTPSHRFVYNPELLAVQWIGDEAAAGRKGDYFLHYAKEELFDLAADPMEHHNAAEGAADIVRGLRDQTAAWIQKYGWKVHEIPKPAPPMSKDTEERIKALGYFDGK